MSEAFDPTLLAQRIDQLESQNEDLKQQVRIAVAELNQAKGRSGIMSAALPLMIAIGGMVFGTVIYSSQQATSGKATANQIELAKVQHRIDENATTIDDVRTRKIKHEDSDGHPEAMRQVATINERLKVVETQIADDDSWQSTVIEDITAIKGLTDRAHLLIAENNKDIEHADEKITSQGRSTSAMAASTQANFQEVETQIRSLNEVYNVRWQGMRSILAIIYDETFGKSLPEEDYYPQNIPASATSTLGEIKTNGN